MNFWILVFSYWLHLLATVVWLGGMALMLLIAWPALRQGTLQSNIWVTLQQRFTPYVNGSLLVLLITGFVQMTNDSNYNGFLVLDSLWAGAILLKHLAFLGMVLISGYVQGFLHPAMSRVRLLAETRPELAESEQEIISGKEVQLLRFNLICAVLVLFFTAIATAV